MTRLVFSLFFITVSLLFPTLLKRFTHGFHIAKMKLEFAYHPEWEGEYASEVESAFSQPFHFIGKGAQSYVFESEDGKYVVKFFRYDQPYDDSKVIKLFNACKIAYDELREETGLVYIHLNPTNMGLPILFCKDPIGRKCRFKLDECRFVVQKKASSFRSTLESLHEDNEGLQVRIDQFLSLLKARTDKEIINTDPNLSRNFGFLADRAIEFDFGNYQKRHGLDRSAEIERYTKRLRRWLSKNEPEWVSYLDQKVEQIRCSDS